MKNLMFKLFTSRKGLLALQLGGFAAAAFLSLQGHGGGYQVHDNPPLPIGG
jgi:hypothetical protein